MSTTGCGVFFCEATDFYVSVVLSMLSPRGTLSENWNELFVLDSLRSMASSATLEEQFNAAVNAIQKLPNDG